VTRIMYYARTRARSECLPGPKNYSYATGIDTTPSTRCLISVYLALADDAVVYSLDEYY